MTNSEYNMLIRMINDRDLKSGKVLKANGQWYIEGKKSDVPRPVIKLPHWTEGTKKVVIEQQKSSPYNWVSFQNYAPYETRTRVSALRGPRPGPLDEQGLKQEEF